MSDTLAAAIVSGVLSGLVVLAGVVLADRLRRRADAAEQQDRLVYDLVGALGRHERALRASPVPDDLAEGHARVMSELFELRNVTRDPLVRTAADECIARVQAALQRALAGTPLPTTGSLGGESLVAAALPATPELTARITTYVRDGLPERRRGV